MSWAANSVVTLGAWAGCCAAVAVAAPGPPNTGSAVEELRMETANKPIPVILDTDIGDDIDDTWALAMLLKSPELRPLLVVSDRGDTIYRAKIIARLLTVAGRTDIPVGIGVRESEGEGAQAPWVKEYRLEDYAGTVHEDGVDAMIRTIMEAPEPVTLICIGPVPNIAEALRREPGIAPRARFVGMHGSVFRGYGGSTDVSAEWNVRADPESCRAALSASWKDITITPVDTCGIVKLAGANYLRVRDCREPVTAAVVENYGLWARHHQAHDPKEQSSILFDTVAVYLAFTTERLTMRRMGVRVTDEGFTVPDPQARQMNVAIDWTDLPGYYDFLAERMLAPVQR